MSWRLFKLLSFLFIWEQITVQKSFQSQEHVSKEFDWIISDRGPFHHSRSYLSFVERHRQGYSTRYKIYREFARWKVRNIAVDRKEPQKSILPLMPEFQRSLRLLGRRPSTHQIIDTIIKKYGTHLVVSATLGGEEALTMYMDKGRLDRHIGNASQSVESLHHLASSYFVDRDGTMRKLHEVQISTSAIKVTETRTGPLGCSSYDNLDSVSSVLLQSTESKLHLQARCPFSSLVLGSVVTLWGLIGVFRVFWFVRYTPDEVYKAKHVVLCDFKVPLIIIGPGLVVTLWGLSRVFWLVCYNMFRLVDLLCVLCDCKVPLLIVGPGLVVTLRGLFRVFRLVRYTPDEVYKVKHVGDIIRTYNLCITRNPLV